MRIRLSVQQADGPARDFDLDVPSITLGRDPACQVPLADNSAVSWSHARIDLKPGVVLLQDLQSTNGTFVNDQLLAVPKVLRAGDRIRLGLKGPTVTVTGVDYDGTDTGPAATVPLGLHSPLQAAGFKPDEGNTTRRLLVEADRRLRRNLVVVAGILGLFVVFLTLGILVLAGVIGHQQQQLSDREDEVKTFQSVVSTLEARQKKAEADAAKARAEAEALWASLPTDGKAIYNNILKSTVFIYDRRTGATGTGAVIDRARKRVLTAYHVTPQNSDPGVLFPEWDADGKPICELNYYAKAANKLVAAKVIAQDSKKDLAVLELDSLPDTAVPLVLAKQSAKPGERVHTVGNPPASSSLWVYNVGSVRAVGKKHVYFSNVNQDVDCWTLEVQNPLNPGDSGGPMVNDHYELVGVNSSVSLKASLVNSCVDIREVHAVLEGIK
jgi:S1-C subfamily serine protease